MKDDPNFRIQDVVARVAGTNLANTVRVLEALYEVSLELGEPEMRNTLEEYLVRGADGIGLFEKPSRENAAASERVYDRVRNRLGIGGLRDIISVDYCKFAEKMYEN